MIKIKSFILPLSYFFLIVSVIFLLAYIVDGLQDRRDQEELIRKKHTTTEVAINEPGPSSKKEILPQYRDLFEENHDLIGWVKIEGTPLDYPVMQNKDDNEYYLHRNFYGEYEYSGLPFLDLKCSFEPPSTNLIIYGHNMKSDAMFSCLTKYTDKDYYLEHPVIQFDTIFEEGKYEIVAVILSEVYKKTDEVFKFYQFTQAENEAEFDEYIRNMKNLSLYETGSDAAFGDHLIILVTCNYHTENGRLAVLAKKYPAEQI